MTSHVSTETTTPGIGRWWWLVIAGLAFILTLKYFPGLENETAYSGLAFKTIHPDAFAIDTYRGGTDSILKNPLQLSLLYGFVKVFGEVWLDDRFLAFVYLGLVIAGLAGVDRTAVLLGLKGIPERLFVLCMFIKDHAILDHKVLLAHHADVNHMAFAIPVIVWLFYAALARKGLPVVFALSLLLLSLSIRNALFAIVFAHIVVFVTGRRWERWAVVGLFVLGIAAVSIMIMFVLPSDSTTRLGLWDVIKTQEEEDANPFQSNFGGALFAVHAGIWMLIIGAAAWLAPKDKPAFLGVRIICVLAILTWLIGGMYISFAPDALKVPLLIGFAPTRALAWPQNLAYIALIAIGFHWLRKEPSNKRLVIVGGAFMALFLVGPGHYMQWAALTSVMIVAVILADRLTGKFDFANHKSRAFAAVLALSVLTGTALSIKSRLDDWRWLFETGVMGGNPAAEWVGIAEYLRHETPKDSVTVAYWMVGDELHPTRSLATRSGRANVTPEFYGPGFQDPAKWRQDADQSQLLMDIGQAFKDGRLEQARILMKGIILQPDYIVVPLSVKNTWQASLPGYADIMNNDRYVILKRQ